MDRQFRRRSKPKEATVPESTYRHHVLRARSTANHFTFTRDYCLIMKKLEALFLQDLINRASMQIPEIDPYNGKEYIEATETYLSAYGMWSPKEQKNYLARLVEMGYVKRKRSGVPSTRWVHIDILAIEKDLHKKLQKGREAIDQNGSGESAPNGTDCSAPAGPLNNVSPNGDTKQDKTPRRVRFAHADSGSGCGGMVGFNGQTPPGLNGTYTPPVPKATPLVYTYMANTLRRYATRYGMATSTWSRQAWAREMAKLAPSRSFDIVFDVFCWYVNQPRHDRMPMAFSGTAFRKKFDNIAKAYEIWKQDHPQVIITKEARDIAADVNRHWPEGVDKSELPVAVQLSLDHLEGLMDKLRPHEDNPDACQVWNELSYGKMFGILVNYFQEVNDIAWHFDGLRGGIKAFALPNNQKRMDKLGAKLADGKDRWERLKEELGV